MESLQLALNLLEQEMIKLRDCIANDTEYVNENLEKIKQLLEECQR